MALVTDAGTPGISDPAFLLVRECIKAGYKSGMSSGSYRFCSCTREQWHSIKPFCFEGFFPLKKGRQTLLKKLAVEKNAR